MAIGNPEQRPEGISDEDYSMLKGSGFDSNRIKHLIEIKREVISGNRSDVTPEARRLEFAKRLYDEGKISG